MSIGGGRGALLTTHGDYPIAALRGIKTQNFDEGRATAEHDVQPGDFGELGSEVVLTILGKNVQSLQTEAREDELFSELRQVEWDVVLLSETWREKARERWKAGDGHMFCGTGGAKGAKGTGILLHRRWVKGFRAFYAISDRVCSIDVDIKGQKIRFVAVYMPHGGQDDADVEGVYGELSNLICSTGRRGRTCILVGDWNAVVGDGRAGDDEQIVGPHGVGSRNERGEGLIHWASTHQISIMNTLFTKCFDEQWTYKNGCSRRQLDYCLINSTRASWVTDATACEDIGLGADHRTIKAILKFHEFGSQKRKKGPWKSRGWRPVDEKVFREELDANLGLPSQNSGDVVEEIQAKCLRIERIIMDVAEKCSNTVHEREAYDQVMRARVHELIERRKTARKAGANTEVKDASKLLRKELRAVARARKSARVTQVLQEFKDLQRISDIRGNGKRACIVSIIDKNGMEKTDEEDIADVFADFFEDLYCADGDAPGLAHDLQDCHESVPAITPGELRQQLRGMKPRKAADEGGMIAEFLCKGSDKLFEIIADIFTAVMNPRGAVPEYWKASSIRVLFKKGDDRLPGNYRPICIIPILYKVFSKVICSRIKQRLIAGQSHDQAGFRPNYSCDDHLFAITLLAEKCNEFNLPLWIATCDYKKAFDSISHGSIWMSLTAQGVPAAYVELLSKLYKGQHANVKGNSTSREFGIGKGTKQGDPISPMIFNSVLEQVMRTVKEKWRKKKLGIQLGCGLDSFMTNLRFADDILLVGRSLHQIKQMLVDLRLEGAKVGLELHPGKTKIQHNGIGYGTGVRSSRIGDMDIEVLEPAATTVYLGRELSLTDTHDIELRHRLAKAWAKFGIYRTELTDREIPLHLRLKLFHSVVTPSVLYGCGSWVMTHARQQALRTTQMKMLRAILVRKRLVLKSPGSDPDIVETWVEWVQRVTREARDQMTEHRIPDWVEEQRNRQLRWKERLDHMERHRWARMVLHWIPEGRRSRGRPCTRWSDKLEEITQLSPTVDM